MTSQSYAARWQARKAAERRAGTWGERLVDPAPARAHIEDLRSRYGVSYSTVGVLAGVNSQRVEQMMQPGHNKYPQRIHVERARLLLSAEWDLSVLPTSALMFAVGANRRLRALCWMGWTHAAIAAELGMAVGNLVGKRREHHTAVGAVQQLHVLYDAWSMREGPSSLTRTRARARGFDPPLAWDDETIDDRFALPYRGEQECEGGVAPVERVRDAFEDGLTLEEIAVKEQVQEETLLRRLRRAEDHQLLRALLERSERYREGDERRAS